MDIYRRIAAVRTREESQDLLDELLDRYGEPPASTLALLDVAMLRGGEACAAGIRDISQRGDTITFTFGGEMPVEAVMRVCAMGKNKRRLTLSAGIEPNRAAARRGEAASCGARAGREHRARRGRLNPAAPRPAARCDTKNSEERGNKDETYLAAALRWRCLSLTACGGKDRFDTGKVEEGRLLSADRYRSRRCRDEGGRHRRADGYVFLQPLLCRLLHGKLHEYVRHGP